MVNPFVYRLETGDSPLCPCTCVWKCSGNFRRKSIVTPCVDHCPSPQSTKMESQQTSQHRRPLLQDPEQPCTVPTPPRRQPWRLIFGCSLGVCVLLLLTLTSLQQPSEARVRIQTISASTQYLHHELGDAGSVRPRIELHPVEHAHRPATTQAFEWRITKDDRRPDGVRKQVYLINGERGIPTLATSDGSDAQRQTFSRVRRLKAALVIPWSSPSPMLCRKSRL